MKYLKITCFLLLAITIACEDTSEIIELSELQQETEKAKSFFDQQIKPLKNQSSSNGRMGETKRLSITEDLDWDRAWTKDLSFGTALAVPIIYDEYYLTPVTRDSIIALEEASYAQFYEDQDGTTVAELVTIMPDVGIKEGNGFSGIITVQDWEGNMKFGFKYVNGEIMPFTNQNNDRGRITCIEYTDYYTSCVGTEANPFQYCTIVYHEPYTVCTGYEQDNTEESCVSCAGDDPKDYDPNSGIPGNGDSDDKPKTADELCGPGMVFSDLTGECEVKCDPGFVLNEIGKCVPKEKPCDGDPVPKPEIAAQKVSGINGGMHGCTRGGRGCPEDAAKKEHNGIDLKNTYGEPVYSMYDGLIYTSKYQENGAGYYTRIQSTVDGSTFILEYYHMQKENRITSGNVKAGDIIGYQGDSGNLKGAIAKGYTVSHLHITTFVHDGSASWSFENNFTKADPRDYLKTEIKDDGTSASSDCN